MHILLDARMMGAERTRGIGRYLEELVRGLLTFPDIELTLLVRSRTGNTWKDEPRVKLVEADVPWYGWKEQLRMPGYLKRTKADVVHIPHWNVPLRFRKPFAMTIHDLILLHHPESAKISTRSSLVAKVKYWAFKKVLASAIKRASVIFVPTQFVADDIATRFPKAKDKLMVTGEGVTPMPAREAEKPAQAPFLFYVGSAYPHKRLDLLLEAWSTLCLEHPTLQLVIAGEKDVFMQQYIWEAKARGLVRVHFVGTVSQASLVDYLDRATAFVFPSSDEGFGLPPLEALARGCPVICSDSSCLPEVLPTEGVIFFKSGDADDMIRGIETVLREEQVYRSAAQAHIPDLLARHDWVKAAERTREGYERLVLKA